MVHIINHNRHSLSSRSAAQKSFLIYYSVSSFINSSWSGLNLGWGGGIAQSCTITLPAGFDFGLMWTCTLFILQLRAQIVGCALLKGQSISQWHSNHFECKFWCYSIVYLFEETHCFVVMTADIGHLVSPPFWPRMTRHNRTFASHCRKSDILQRLSEGQVIYSNIRGKWTKNKVVCPYPSLVMLKMNTC